MEYHSTEEDEEAETKSRWDYFKQLLPKTSTNHSILLSPERKTTYKNTRYTQNHLQHRPLNSTQRYRIDSNYCKNCGNAGHMFHKCKLPITSIGIIAFRIPPEPPPGFEKREIQYLTICRKDSLGYVDFIRGKYTVKDKEYIMSMVKQMSVDEKRRILENDFEVLWNLLWGETAGLNQYKTEKQISRENFNQLKRGIEGKGNGEEFSAYDLKSIIEESRRYPEWDEPEWGFPKGRRNHLENEYTCALREFQEETGFASNSVIHVQNIIPVEEVFVGSNLKTYKHKYYVMMMNYEESLNMSSFQKSEVSKMEWKTKEECLRVIRPYNLEKRKLIETVHFALTQNDLFTPMNI
jgi:8-oxo-dGTP pyrophosphatase MutT (NUDIX family)